MPDYPDVFVRLKHDQYVALRGTVADELESLTKEDVASGAYLDLFMASYAMDRAWLNWIGRVRKAASRG